MVLLAAIGNADAEYYVADKWRGCQCLPTHRKIVGKAEHQFVNAYFERRPFEERRIATPAMVGHGTVQQLPVSPLNKKHRHGDARAWQAECGIEHMRGQSAHYFRLFNFAVMA